MLLAASALAQPTNTIPDLKPPLQELPPTFWEQHAWALAAAAIALLAGIAFVIWRLTRPKPVSVTPPEVIARQTLAALRGRPEDEPLVRQVSQAIRRYVVAAFGLEQVEPTTEELAAALDRAWRVAGDRPLVVGQPSRLPPGASRPRTSTGETPSLAGGTPAPLPAAGGALAPLHSSSTEPGAAMGLGHLSPDLVAALGDFLRECDARKFAPVPPPASPGLVSRALDLVARCEAERRPAAVPAQAQAQAAPAAP